MYNTFIAYLLWFISGFGALGFHRFYLGKIPTGLLWMCTGGLGMVGSIYDFFTLPNQVNEANIRKALFDRQDRVYHYTRYTSDRIDEQTNNWRYAKDAQYRVVNGKGKEKPERMLLRLAKENNGKLTVSEVVLGADISIDEAKKLLEALVSKGFAELRVTKSGSLVYVIPDMMNRDDPLEDF